MFDSSPPTATTADALAKMRADGRLRLVLAARAGVTRAAETFESGGLRARFPNGRACEAVLINTSGGLVGGDRASYDISAAPGAVASVTTPAAEKVYRSLGPDTVLDVRLSLGAGAALDWLPQETILFSGARLARRLEIDMAEDARLLVAESVVFGRPAMGETMGDGALVDHWRVRRGGRLIYAEAIRLDGDLDAALARPAIGNGARAVATVLLVASDAEARLDTVRAILDGATCAAGASAWNGQLVVRISAVAPQHLRAALVRVLIGIRGGPLPRVW